MAQHRVGWIPWLVLVLFVWRTPEAAAHPSPASNALLDFTVDGLRIEQDVPVEELELAIHRVLRSEDETTASMVAREDAFLRAYAGEHMRIVGSSGTPWSVAVEGVEGYEADDGPRIRFLFAAVAPAGEANASVVLHDDLVTHEVRSHYTYVHVRSDWAGGKGHGEPRMVGAIHAFRQSLAIEREGSFGTGLLGVVSSGVEHIATGTDHLMFVLALLLVAPLAASGRRWEVRPGWRPAAVTLTKLITAFTLGHSATLILGALDLVTLPASVVEPLIALSVLCAGVHAITPVFPRREGYVAFGFGLIHGLAFASLLPRQDLGAVQTAWTLLGFNVGIEVAQLVLVAVVFPWLLLLAHTRASAGVRVAGGLVASAFAAGWFIERVAGVANPLAAPLAWLEAHPWLLLGALVVGSVAASFRIPTTGRLAQTA